MDIKEYKCPNCSGAVQFDSSLQQMKCPYCDSEFDVEAISQYQKEIAEPMINSFEMNTEKALVAFDESELADLSTGNCPSCGAELVGDKNTIATICPCCGNTQIVLQRVAGF